MCDSLSILSAFQIQYKVLVIYLLSYELSNQTCIIAGHDLSVLFINTFIIKKSYNTAV